MIDQSIEVILEILSPLLRTVWKIAYKFTKRGRKGAIIASTIFLIILAVPVIILFILIYKGIVYLTSQRNHFLIIILILTASPVPILLIIVFKIFIKLIKQVTKLRESPLSSGEKIKSIEDIETALGSGEEAKPFKLGWLNKKDTQQTVRRDEVDELKKLFKKHRAILLEGHPASGKTVIAKQFGLEMAKKGYFVYYANLTVRRGLGNYVTPETLPNELKEELLGNLNVDIYIIIEDIHNYLNEYDAMNWTADSKNKIKLLLVSRPIREHVFTGERQLKSKKTEQFSWTHKFEIKGDQVLPQIVEKALKMKEFILMILRKLKKSSKGIYIF